MFRTKTESTSFVITTNLIIQLGKSGATLHTKYASRTHQSFRMTVYNAYMVMTYVVSTKFSKLLHLVVYASNRVNDNENKCQDHDHRTEEYKGASHNKFNRHDFNNRFHVL